MPRKEGRKHQVKQLLGFLADVKPQLTQNPQFLYNKEIQAHIATAIKDLESILQKFEDPESSQQKGGVDDLTSSTNEATSQMNKNHLINKDGDTLVKKPKRFDERLSDYETMEYMLKESPAVLYKTSHIYPFPIDFLSDNAKNVLGYDPSELLNEPDYWINKLHPEDAESVNVAFQELISKGGGKIEYRFLMGNGEYKWLLEKFKVQYNEEGKEIGLVGCLIDINDKKEAEILAAERLRETETLNEELSASDEEIRQSLDNVIQLNNKLQESEQLNKWVISSINEGIIVFDNEGHVQLWNVFLEQLTDVPTSEVVGKHIEEIFPRSKESGVLSQLKSALSKQEKTTSEIFVSHKAPSGMWLRISVSPLVDNNQKVIGAIATVLNITESKKAQKALQEQKDLLQVFFDSAPFAMCVIEVLDNDYRYILSNRFIANFLAIPLEEIQSRKASELGIPKSIIESTIILVKECIEDNVTRQIEFNFPRFDGEERTLFCTYAPLSSNTISLTSIDITSQKQAEKEKNQLLEDTQRLYKELEVSHQKLLDAKEIAGIGMWEFDLKNHIGKVSSESRLLGVANYEEIKEEEFINMVAPEDVPIFKSAWQGAQAGVPFDIVIKLKTPDGYFRWERSIAKPVFDLNGKVVKLVGVIFDLTKEKESEEKIAELLRQSQNLNRRLTSSEEELKQALDITLDLNNRIRETEQRWKFALESNAEGVWDWNMENNQVFYSARCKELLGYSEKEEVNELYHWESKIHPEDKEMVKSALESYLKENVDFYTIEYRCVRGEGDTFWALVRGKVVEKSFEGKPMRMIGTMGDISERKENEERISNLAAYLDKIINTIIDPIFVKDDQHRWVLINDACCEYFQISREQIIGCTDSDFFPKETADEMRMLEGEVLKTGKDRIKEEFVTKADGRKHTIIVKKSLCVADNGQKFIVGIFVDVTEQKNWERKLKEQNESLKKINSELDSFVYRTSHDLRSPLTSVLGLINISRLEPDEAIRRSYLDLMEKSISRLDNFIQDILNYSRNTRVDIAVEEIDIKALFGDIFEGLKYMEGYEDTDKRIEIDQNAIFYSDLFRLKIVFNNLVSNAIKYRSTLVEKSFIHIKVMVNEHSAVFVISDNGKGIAKDNTEKIFDMFYRASTQSTGSGLGLYIVKETVQTLKGEIVVKSELGFGTTFRIVLPNKRP